MKGGNFCILSTTCLKNFGCFAFISLQNTRFLSFLTLLNDSPTKEKPAASVMTLIVTLKFILLLKRYGQFLKNMNFIIWTLLNGKCDGEFKCKIRMYQWDTVESKVTKLYDPWFFQYGTWQGLEEKERK